MQDQLVAGPRPIEIAPATSLSGTVEGVYVAEGKDFVAQPASTLSLTYDGIAGDFHGGATRKSGSREPWYPRGTEMRNERQVSILAPDELVAIAQGLGLAEVRPEWMGGNLLLDGIPQLSMLPARTLLFFEGGVTLKVDGQNGPCKATGRSIAEHGGAGDVTTTALDFVKVAKRLRGLVAWVEKPGAIRPGERFKARLPEQWIYPA